MDSAELATFVKSLEKATKNSGKSNSLTAAVSLEVGTAVARFSIQQGKVASLDDDAEVDLRVKLSKKDFDGYLSKDHSFSTSYIRGDFKPEGSTGSLLAFLEIFEDTKSMDLLRDEFESGHG